MVGGSSVVFNPKAVVSGRIFQYSTKVCKWIVGVIATQFYPFAMCQSMPTGLNTRWDFEADLQRFKPKSNRARSFELLFLTQFQISALTCKTEIFLTRGVQKESDCFRVNGFFGHCNTVFEPLGCFVFFECQEEQPGLAEEDIVKRQKRSEMDNLRRSYLREKKFSNVQMSKCE